MKYIYTILLLFFLIGYCGLKFYGADLDILNLSIQQSRNLWILSLIKSISIYIFSFLIVAVSISQFIYTKDKKYIAQIICGLTFNLLILGTQIYAYIKFTQMPQVSDHIIENKPEMVKAYTKLLNSKEFEMEELSKRTELFATILFEDSGIIVPIINKKGNKENYSPSPESIETRKKNIQIDAFTNHQKTSIKRSLIEYTIMLFTAVLTGLTFQKIRRYKKPWQKKASTTKPSP